MSKINNIILYLSNKHDKISHLIGWITLLFIIYFCFKIIDLTSKKFINDFSIPIQIYLIIFVFLFSVFYFLKVYISKGFLYNKLTSKLNFWNILAISLILTLIPLVFNIYNNYTNYPLPIKGYLAISDQSRNLFYNNTNIPLWVMCFNERGERDYILNKDITCHVNITYKENYTFYLHEIDLTYFLKDDSQYTKQIPINNNSIQNLTQFFNFLVYINETFDQALIQFNFIDTNNNLVKVSSLWIYPPERILTEEQYFTKREQSLSLIIGLFSLLIFSIISAIKNFKDL